MKSAFLLAAVLFFSSSVTDLMFAQSNETRNDTLIEYPVASAANYLNALKHHNAGVVESAIFHAAKYKMMNLDADTDAMETQLRHLNKEGKTSAVRYKAGLVVQYFESPDLFDNIHKKNYKADSDELYAELAMQLQREYLVNWDEK